MSRLTGLVAVAVLLVADHASAYNRGFGRWSTTASPRWPVVPVYVCRDVINSHFGGFPIENIKLQLNSAMNEWFVGGGADFRMRFAGDILGFSGKCAVGGAPPSDGSIVITAENNSGVNGCDVARAFPSWDGSGQINGSRVILFRQRQEVTGINTCEGALFNTNWAFNAAFPQSGQTDFWAVLLHELGHSVGFDHPAGRSCVFTPAVMCTGNSSRHLHIDDRNGFRDDPALGYGPIQTNLFHRRSTDNGVSWQFEGEPAFIPPVVGSPGICNADTPPLGQLPYLLAYAESGTDQINVLTTDGVGTANRVNLGTSYSALGAAVACKPSGGYVLAYRGKDTNRTIYLRTSADGVNWSADSPFATSTTAPAIAWANFRGAHVMAYTDAQNRITTALSWNGGASFGQVQGFSYWDGPLRSSHHVGLTCQDSGGYCSLVWADAAQANSTLHTAVLRFDANPPGAGNYLFVESRAQLTAFPAYGAAVTNMWGRFQYAWRDRGTATTLVSGGWPWPPTLDNVNFTGLVAHAVPAIAWDYGFDEYSMWSTFGSRYDR